MIAEWQHDHYEVYAIALPEERIVSVCPKCDMGHIAHMLWRIKNMFILTGIFFFSVLLAGVISEVIDGTWEGLDSFITTYILLYIMAFLLGVGVSGLIAFSAYKACAPTRCKLAEEIFQLLGVKNIAAVNLNKITKEREQQLKRKGGWHEPDDENKTTCPSADFIYSRESWFYY